MKVKKRYIVIGLILAGALFFFLYQVFTGTMFLYRSVEEIEEKLLLKTPVGTSLEEVREYLEGTDFSVSSDKSFGHRIGSGSRRGLVVGDHVIRVDLGNYHVLPWELAAGADSLVEAFWIWIFADVDVVAVWIFEYGAVTEISVDKQYNAL